MPRSPRTVSYPLGKARISSWIPASRAAHSTRSRSTSSRPKAMFSNIVSLKRKGSWGATPTALRRTAKGMRLASCPPT